MKTSTGERAGFIGLGAMGMPMAHKLYESEQLEIVWNRSMDKLDAFLQRHDVKRALRPADVANNASVVFTCVSADADLLEVIDQLLPGLNEGSTVVDCSTVSRDTAAKAGQPQGKLSRCACVGRSGRRA